MGQARIEVRNQKLSMIMSGGQKSTRSSRFAARMSGNPPLDFSSLSALPHWALRIREDGYRKQLSRMAALLYFRPQMDREISGAKLQSIAEEFGEELIDAALSAELPPMQLIEDVSLPRPDKMEAKGNAMIDRAMAVLNPVEVSSKGDADAQSLLSIAAMMVEELSPPATEGGA